MSEAIDNMDAYIQLTDEVFQQILHSSSTDEKMEMVQCNFGSILNLRAHSIDMHTQLIIT